jgi:UDP-glucose 4-epimerase
MKILITGGAGFIGSHIVELYQDRAEEIRVLDNLRTGNRHNLKNLKHIFIEGSVTDRELVKKAVQGVDYIFHLAAMVSAPESMENPLDCMNINVNGLLNVLIEAKEAKVKKIVLASSAAIYGNNPTLPKNEDMVPEPASFYAISKFNGECILNIFQNESQMETAAIRIFNVFGPRQNPNGIYANAIPSFIQKILKNENVIIFGDGNQTRDFIYVKDVASAFSFVAETSGMLGVFNVGYGEQTTINEFIDKLINSVGSSSKKIFNFERPGDVVHSCANPEKLQAAGWKPTYTLHEGLDITLNYFMNNVI